jgi:hypothetical protein
LLTAAAWQTLLYPPPYVILHSIEKRCVAAAGYGLVNGKEANFIHFQSPMPPDFALKKKARRDGRFSCFYFYFNGSSTTVMPNF